MKRCPQCRQEYFDETLNFCLEDGTSLQDVPTSDDAATTRILPNATSEDVTEAYRREPTADNVSLTKSSTKKPLIAGAVGLTIIALLAFGGYLYFGKSSHEQIESIAVMPFINEGGDPEIEYLADGMTESLIGSLSQVPNLNVKARSSVFRYKGRDNDVRTLGRELGVQAILSGRIVPRGNEVTLYIELIDAVTENVHFKADYIQPLTNLVALQKNVAHDVSRRLRAALTATEQQKVEKSHTQNAEAYRLYLQGRFHWNKRQPEEHRKAIRFFEQATALDPQYALAYAGIADCYAVESSPVKGPERIRLLREAAEKALRLDPNLGQPHAALANSYWDSYDWAAAERSFQRAIELEPGYATAHQWYGELLSRLGRHDEALTRIRRAQELDPLSLVIASDTIYILANARRYDEALEQARKTREMDATWSTAYFLEGITYEYKGDLENALQTREKAVGITTEITAEQRQRALEEITLSRKALAENGPTGYWRAQLGFELNRRDRPGEFPGFYIAEIYSYLNEKDEAFKWLNQAIDSRDAWIDLAKVAPSFDNLRSDPRWPQVLARINMTP